MQHNTTALVVQNLLHSRFLQTLHPRRVRLTTGYGHPVVTRVLTCTLASTPFGQRSAVRLLLQPVPRTAGVGCWRGLLGFSQRPPGKTAGVGCRRGLLGASQRPPGKTRSSTYPSQSGEYCSYRLFWAYSGQSGASQQGPGSLRRFHAVHRGGLLRHDLRGTSHQG
jgi:hypothetical protein